MNAIAVRSPRMGWPGANMAFKPLTLAFLVTGIFTAGIVIGSASVFLMIAAALA